MNTQEQIHDPDQDPISAEFDLAMALGWRPWYDRPGDLAPAAWVRPDGTRVADVPDWRELLSEVRCLHVPHGYTCPRCGWWQSPICDCGYDPRG